MTNYSKIINQKNNKIKYLEQNSMQVKESLIHMINLQESE